jgi:hypothetical protein
MVTLAKLLLTQDTVDINKLSDVFHLTLAAGLRIQVHVKKN